MRMWASQSRPRRFSSATPRRSRDAKRLQSRWMHPDKSNRPVPSSELAHIRVISMGSRRLGEKVGCIEITEKEADSSGCLALLFSALGVGNLPRAATSFAEKCSRVRGRSNGWAGFAAGAGSQPEPSIEISPRGLRRMPSQPIGRLFRAAAAPDLEPAANFGVMIPRQRLVIAQVCCAEERRR